MAQKTTLKTQFPILLLLALLAGVLSPFAKAQNLTLEGQTGGFITPTGYVLQAHPGHDYSKPAVGYHFINAGSVIGTISTLNVTEGLYNRVEFGYTRTIHTNGSDKLYGPLWYFSGMNILHGKVNVVKEDSFGSKWIPAIGFGGVYRMQDQYVSGAIANKSYQNGDIYVAATKTALNIKPALLINVGFKMTNASIFGIGGNATRFQGRFFGGVGFPLPGPWGLAFVPAAGFTQEPQHVKNLSGADIPTTLDYAVRITQRDQEKARFALDIGVGQVAGRVITSSLGNVNLDARHVLGLGASYKF